MSATCRIKSRSWSKFPDRPGKRIARGELWGCIVSGALEDWLGSSKEVLDEIELVHGKVEGTGAGRRVFTQQVNYAYAALIAAHFQRYCRALHTEATQVLVAAVSDPALAGVLEGLLTQNRLLDKGNPTPSNLGVDFGRFGFKFWEQVEGDDSRNAKRKAKLEHLCEWRNGIAHGDIGRKRAAGQLVPANLKLATCKQWRRALGGLAVSIDKVVAEQCENLGCEQPW